MVLESILAQKTGESSQEAMDWDAIYGLMMDALYGGRVDTPTDTAILRTYVKQFFNDETLFGTSFQTLNLPPSPCDRSDQIMTYYKDAIQRLPDVDSPLSFGLSSSIEELVQQKQTSFILARLKLLDTSQSLSSSSFSKEAWRRGLRNILDLWDRLVAESPELIKYKPVDTKKVDKNNPVDDFICMEFNLGVHLLKAIHTSLSSIKKLLYGSSNNLLSPFLQAIGSSLLMDTLPESWSKIGYGFGPSSPAFWVASVVRKTRQLRRMTDLVLKGQHILSSSSSSSSSSFQLASIFHPIPFLSSLKQLTAKSTRQDINTLKLVSRFGHQSISSLELSVTLEGLFLEGGHIRSNLLADDDNNSNNNGGGGGGEGEGSTSSLFPLPAITVGFLREDSPVFASQDHASSSIVVPVYLNKAREEWVENFTMPSRDTKEKWILKNVAVFIEQE